MRVGSCFSGGTGSHIEGGDVRICHDRPAGISDGAANGTQISTLAEGEKAAADNKRENQQNGEIRTGFHKQLHGGQGFGNGDLYHEKETIRKQKNKEKARQ